MKNTEQKNVFRVLSIDGGGFRGLYTATLLNTLTKRFSENSNVPLDIGKKFDLIVGTSTGGILSCALAAGIPITEIIDIYVSHGKEIFTDPQPENKLKLLFWGCRNKRKNSCNADKLKEILKNTFNDTTIKQAYIKRNIAVCIPTIDVVTHHPWVFKTPHNKGKNRDDNYSLVDVCMATSAAPIYFPIHTCASPDNSAGKQFFVDGGLWANNPVLIGIAEALQIDKDKEIEIISIGTLPAPVGSVIHKANRGLLDWKFGAEALLLGMDAQASGYDYTAQFLATSLSRKCTVTRIDKNKICPSPDQAKCLAMDAADDCNMTVLIKLAESAADRIHGEEMAKINKGEPSIIANIFQNLSPLEGEIK